VCVRETVCVYEFVSVCMSVFAYLRERERESVCVSVCVCMRVRVCVTECDRA
jgi:hypothetical protein